MGTTASFDTFERLKTRGLDARRAGNHAAARVYLLEASAMALELSRSARTPALAEARRQTAARLLELARASAAPASAPHPQTDAPESDGGADAAPAGAHTWLVRERPRVRFDDVAGLEIAKEQLRLRAVYPFTHPELAERFGLRGGGGVLLYGPPGTGKTLLARAVAGEVEAAFFRVSAAELLSKWVGEAEQNVRRLFDAARAEPRSVVFVDEVEALLPGRRDDAGGVMQRVVPQFLQALDGFDQPAPGAARTLFLAATNVPWQLDPAVLRPGRLDEKVYIPLPDAPARLRLLELNLCHRPLSDDLDLPAVAERLDGYSGADIRYLCDKAAQIPFLRAIAQRGTAPITAEVIEQALALTPRSVLPDAVRRFETWASA